MSRAPQDQVSLPGLPAVVALLTGALLVLLLHPDWTPPQLDEMTHLGAGARLLRGELPYAGFHEFAPPGFLALHGGLLAVLGPRLLAFRLVALAALAAASWLLWRCLRREGDGGLAASAALGCTWAFAWWPSSYPAWWGGAALLAWVALEVRRREAGAGRAASAAWVASLAAVALTSQPSALAAVVVLAALALPGSMDAPARRSLARHLAAVAVVGLAVIGALAAAGLLGPAFRDVVAWPLLHYKQEGGANDVSLLADALRLVSGAAGRGGPLVGVLAAASLVVLALLPAAALAALVASRADEATRHRRRLGLALLAAAALCFALAKQDVRHAVMQAPLALAALALAGPLAPRGGAAWRAARLGAWLAVPALACVPLVRSAGPLPPWSSWRDADAPYRALADAARELARENGGTLPVLSRSGQLEFYGVPNPLPRSVLLPPSMGYGAPQDQEEAAAALQAAGARYVLLYPSWEASAFLGEDGPVSDILRRDYEPFAERGDALLLRRR